MPAPETNVTWTGSTAFRVADVDFTCSFGDSTIDRFCIRKPRRLVDATIVLLQGFRSPRIVEFGIASGGSTALLALVAQPRRLVALELDSTPVEPLAELLEGRGLTESIRPFYGVDQGDRARVSAIIGSELGDEPLDLVIDDASHRLDETRAAFETVFPRLRPGGLYVIEDWNWQLRLRYSLTDRPGAADVRTGTDADADADAMLDEAGGGGRADFAAYLRDNLDRQPLETLALELVLARACSGRVVDDLRIGESWVVVRRGDGTLDPETFRIADNYVGVRAALGL